MDQMYDDAADEQSTFQDWAGADETEAAPAAEGEGFESAFQDQGQGSETVPAEASDLYGGPSDVAGTEGSPDAASAAAPASEGQDKTAASGESQDSEEEKAKKEDKEVKDGYGSVKDLYKLKDFKLKPGYGGLKDIPDIIKGGKGAYDKFHGGDLAGGTTGTLETLGKALKSIAPAVAKLAPSAAPALVKALGPIGTGLQAGTAVANYGLDKSAQNDTLQKVFGALGVKNANGKRTSITDAQINLGRRAGQGVTSLTGSKTLGKVADWGVSVASSVPAVPFVVGSAAGGAAKWGYNKLRHLFKHDG